MIAVSEKSVDLAIESMVDHPGKDLNDMARWPEEYDPEHRDQLRRDVAELIRAYLAAELAQGRKMVGREATDEMCKECINREGDDWDSDPLPYNEAWPVMWDAAP